MQCNAILQYKTPIIPEKSRIFADMNKFDYTSVPGDLLYCDRRDLDDFGVDEIPSLNYLIHNRLYDRYSSFADYENFVKDLFNCAYYICTMALADAHPERRFGAYVRVADMHTRFHAEYGGAVLAIVLLQIRAHHWDKQRGISWLSGSLEKELSNEKYGDIYQSVYTDVLQTANNNIITVSPDNEFRPRKISFGVLRGTCSHWDWKSHFGTDKDEMLKFIFAIGKNEEEQKTIASFLQEETHASFANGAEHKYCFEHIDREIYLKYHADEEKDQIEAEIEEDLMKEYEQQWELDYYKAEFPKLKAENESLHAEIEQIKIKIKDVDDRHSVTQEQFNAIFYPEGQNAVNDKEQIIKSENKDADEHLQQQLTDAQKKIDEQAQTINEQQAELKRLSTMNEVLTKQNARFDEENPEMDIDEETALSIKECIIFFSSIMDCNLNKEDISQMNLARLISKITRWPKESIRPQIVDINTERENNAKDHTAFSDGVHQAAVNVCALIENAMNGLKKNPLPYSCKQAVENICKIYKSPGREIEPHEIAEAKKNLKKI